MSAPLIVGAVPQPFAGKGTYFDARAPVPRPEPLSIDESGAHGPELVIGADTARWPLTEIRALRDQARRGRLILRHAGGGAERLAVDDPESIRILRARCSLLNRLPRQKGVFALLFWAGAALASVLLILFFLIPFTADRLAPFVPARGEVSMGLSTFERVRSALGKGAPVPLCSTPEADAALAKIEARLFPALDLDYPLVISIFDHPAFNAIALPGGQIVLFRGIIERAETPEELAAVIAHEAGHVVSHDPVRSALRSAGSFGVLGMVFGDFAGGAVLLFLTERLIDANYGQQSEMEADLFGHDTMRAAGLRPDSIASLFERLRAEGGQPEGLVAHFLSHPAIGDRIAASRTASAGMEQGTPLLLPQEWDALKNVCAN